MKVPSPKQCCFCLPLRKGLLCIGYVRLTLCLLIIGQYYAVFLNELNHTLKMYANMIALDFGASVAAQILDLAFTLVFILATHKRNLMLFKVFYFYSVTLILVYTLVILLIICDSNQFDFLYYIVFQNIIYVDYSYYSIIGLGMIVIVLQSYFTLLVKSELANLKEHSRTEPERESSSTSVTPPKLNTDV